MKNLGGLIPPLKGAGGCFVMRHSHAGGNPLLRRRSFFNHKERKANTKVAKLNIPNSNLCEPYGKTKITFRSGLKDGIFRSTLIKPL